MTKNDLIAKLQKIPGNPPVLMKTGDDDYDNACFEHICVKRGNIKELDETLRDFFDIHDVHDKFIQIEAKS